MKNLYRQRLHKLNPYLYFWQPQFDRNYNPPSPPTKQDIRERNRSQSMEGNVLGIVRQSLGVGRETQNQNPLLTKFIAGIVKLVVKELKIKHGISYGKNYEELQPQIQQVVLRQKKLLIASLSPDKAYADSSCGIWRLKEDKNP